MHRHHYLAGSRSRIRHLLKLHDFGLTECMDTNRFHDASPVVTVLGSSRQLDVTLSSPGSRGPDERSAICRELAVCLLPSYLVAAAAVLLAAPRKAGITCLPNSSIDCMAFSCGMVSVCMIIMT